MTMNNTEKIYDRQDLLSTALQIDLEVRKLYDRGVKREQDSIDYTCEELGLDKSNSLIQELHHSSFVEVTRNIYW